MSKFTTSNTTAPYGNAVAVTKDDSTVIEVTDALLIGTAGNINVRMASGNRAVIPVPVGIFPLAVDQVLSTNTTAAGITALYRRY